MLASPSTFDRMVADGMMPGPKRVYAASRLAELGCTEFEIMAITGHQTSKEVTRYTKAASQRLRAESALAKLTGTKS